MSLVRAIRVLEHPLWVDAEGREHTGPAPGLAYAPAIRSEDLGARAFREAHGVRLAYVAGEMARGIAGTRMVLATASAGLLGFFGAAGLPIHELEPRLRTIAERAPPGAAWGSNLLYDPLVPGREEGLVDLYLRLGLRRASASAYATVTPGLLRWRLAGITALPDGRILTPNHLFAKVSRIEVARRFLEPAPEHLLKVLVERGALSAAQARMAEGVPVAEDITAEADSGGHTDRQPLVALLPAMLSLRQEVLARHRYATPPRIGAAGGLGTPLSVAAAFLLGADYVLTGSINQASVEADTHGLVKEMLAAATASDTAMAAAPDAFEIGGEVQVLRAGTLYHARSRKLSELYRRYASLDELPAAERQQLEERLFRAPIAEVWERTRVYFEGVDPAQTALAERDPHHKMALVFRWYLGLSSRWAQEGQADRKADFQVWCGPAMGAFNAWARGGPLEPLAGRRVAEIATHLMRGAAAHLRARVLAAQGVAVPEPHLLDRAEEAVRA